MNRWVEDSRAWLHSTHPEFWITNLLIKFSYVGSVLVPILHRSILMRYGAMIFQSFVHLMLGLGFVWMWDVEMRYADLTENLPLGSGIQISVSG